MDRLGAGVVQAWKGLKAGGAGKSAELRAAERLCDTAIRQARTPIFYTDYGVEDTLDGRFDLAALHGFLIMRRLLKGDVRCVRLNQIFVEALVARFDDNLRELGVGDMSISKKVRAMGEAFLGRAAAYDSALQAESNEALEAALTRNLFRGRTVPRDHLAALAAYVQAQDDVLAGQADIEACEGALRFGPAEAILSDPHSGKESTHG